MARFITFFSYTPDAAKALIAHPSDRSAAVKTLIESVGGTLDGFYWMQGQHDGFAISTAPDGVAAGAVSLAVGANGAILGLETHQIYDHDEQTAIVEQAAAARSAYRAPTA